VAGEARTKTGLHVVVWVEKLSIPSLCQLGYERRYENRAEDMGNATTAFKSSALDIV
jgi:hypothetical protein